MSHFWLLPDEQALMDSATSTVSDYGYIGAFDMGTNTKVALRKLLGYEARPEDQIRPHKLVNRTQFYVPEAKQHMRAKVLVRMTKAQALMLKLKHQSDSVEARIYDDPTGEYWGNLLIAQSYMPETSCWGSTHGYESRWGVIGGLTDLLRGDGFGPTLEMVADYAEPLPEDWRRAFVLYHFDSWPMAHDKYDCTSPLTCGKPGQVYDLMEALAIFKGIFEEPMTRCGQRWATDFWNLCQNAHCRAKYGIK